MITRLQTLSLALCVLFTSVSWAEPPNLACLRSIVQKYHDSGEYAKEISEVIDKAHRHLLQRIKLNATLPDPKKLAVVLDIDETSLSSYHRMVKRGFFVSNKQELHDDIRAADATVIKPTLSLYQTALNHGVAVFFVTGRNEEDKAATIKNLTQAGYHYWTKLYFKPTSFNTLSAVTFKAQTRAAIIKQGYTIVANIGDQDSDLRGGYAEKGFKLPNPYYYLP